MPHHVRVRTLYATRVTWRGRADFEEGKPVAKFTKGEAKNLAHKIGHYTLGLGDFVTTYTDGY